MIRILQLFESTADFEAQRCAQTLLQSIGAPFVIEQRVIGRSGAYRDVVDAAAALRRESADFDVVHAWGGRALTAAALGTRAAILFSPPAETRHGTVRWLRSVMEYRHVEVVAPTATLRRVLVERGVALARCHLIRPGMDFSRIRRRRDPALRLALGFGESDRVILAAGESTRRAAHWDAVWAVGILHAADARYRLLTWGRGEMVGQMRHFADKLQQPQLLAIGESRLGRRVEFEELFSPADVVLVSARGAVATLPIAIAMGAALPIVSTVTYTTSELLEDRHTALMTPPKKPRQLARRILDLEEDAGVQWTIADMARTEAYEYFSQSRFLNQFRAVYRQIAAGEKVDVPEQAPGAGLRFHGRAG